MKLLRTLGRRLRARPRLPTALEVGDLRYAVRWSARRRTVEIAVGVEGELRLAAPIGCSLSFLVDFAKKKEPWVRSKLAARLAVPRPAAPCFEPGGRLPYLGESLPIVRAARARPVLCLVEGRFELASGADAAGQRHFVRWARRQAEERLLPRLAELAARCGRQPSSARVREMGRRWGSCASDGRISLNWRLVLLAPALADYVLVHELAHLAEPNHGAGFWRLVESRMPDFRERRAELRRVAAEIAWAWEPAG